MIKRILIANRGEIAVRVIRTARELGIKTVSVYSDADKNALHVALADYAIHIGASSPVESYLNIPKIIEAAKTSGVDAIHPGYGFLSENPAFAKAVVDAGFIFIGPSAESMKLLGNKIESRKLAISVGVQVTPGLLSSSLDAETISKEAAKIGFPVLIKAAAGGGGKGMRIVKSISEISSALEGAMREAKSAFGDSTVYLEKYIADPRHVEIQIFCDQHGNALHMGERECSIQRRHQKIIEESPSVALNTNLREKMGAAAVKVVKAAKYEGAGTVEFLLDGENFYFLEVNTRLQVEHPVTESVVGEDLVAWQIKVSSGEPLPKKQNEIKFHGHAIECRIYAEDPANNFLPSSGKILALEEPHIPGVRIDSGVREGSDVSVFYDPILSKIIVFADTRELAIQKMKATLEQYVLLGVSTPIEILSEILSHPAFEKGDISTHFLDKHFTNWSPSQPDSTNLALALFAASRAVSNNHISVGSSQAKHTSPWQSLGSWQIAEGGLS